MVSVVVKEPTTISAHTPFSASRVKEIVQFLFKIKMVACYDEAPLPVGRGRDPGPLTPEVVRVLKMATPYVTDETGGECGNRGAASPGILGLGVPT